MTILPLKIEHRKMSTTCPSNGSRRIYGPPDTTFANGNHIQEFIDDFPMLFGGHGPRLRGKCPAQGPNWSNGNLLCLNCDTPKTGNLPWHDYRDKDTDNTWLFGPWKKFTGPKNFMTSATQATGRNSGSIPYRKSSKNRHLSLDGRHKSILNLPQHQVCHGLDHFRIE